MRAILFLLALALALPATGQEARKPARKRAPHVVAHIRPTPQQIREFDALEKKEEDRGRSPNSRQSRPEQSAAPSPARAPSPK